MNVSVKPSGEALAEATHCLRGVGINRTSWLERTSGDHLGPPPAKAGSLEYGAIWTHAGLTGKVGASATHVCLGPPFTQTSFGPSTMQ